MRESKFVTSLMACGFTATLAEKIYRALLEEEEYMLESYLHTARLLYDDKEEM